MGRRGIFLLISLGLLSLPGMPAGASTILLGDVEKAVLARNPAILSAQARARSARGMALASAAWPAPGLGVTYSDFPRPGLDTANAQSRSLDISQEVPFPGKTILAYRTSSRDAEKAEAEAGRVVQDQLFEARQAYWDLVVASGTVRYLDRARESLAGIVALSEKRNRFGQVSRMEQLMGPMARMEQSSLKSLALDFRQERLMAETRLNELMGANPGDSLGDPVEPAVETGEDLGGTKWLDDALDDSPMVAVALKDLRAMQARRDQARAGWLPDLMLQYSAVEMKDGRKSGMAMARVSVPFAWFWGPIGENKAASAEVGASSAMLDESRLNVRRMATDEVSRLAVVREQLDIFNGEILPQTEKALGLAVSGYQSGSVGPADVLTAVRSYISMNTERLMLSAQAGRSVAVLKRLKGG